MKHFISPSENLAEINITPFVDVVLVLLIIFMITAPLLQQGFGVDLPQAKAPEIAASPKDVTLMIDGRGLFYLGDIKKPISKEELTSKLFTLYRTKKEKNLYIQADQGIRYAKVVEAMSLAHEAGVERIGMITQPEKK